MGSQETNGRSINDSSRCLTYIPLVIAFGLVMLEWGLFLDTGIVGSWFAQLNPLFKCLVLLACTVAAVLMVVISICITSRENSSK